MVHKQHAEDRRVPNEMPRPPRGLKTDFMSGASTGTEFLTSEIWVAVKELELHYHNPETL